MEFLAVAEAFDKLEATASRLEMTDILAELFSSAPPEEVGKISYLCLGHFGPEYDERVLGLGDKIMLKAIAMATHRLASDVDKKFKELGDLGLVAEDMMSSGKGFSLAAFTGEKRDKITVSRLFASLDKISKASGQKSQDQKIKLIAGLLADASGTEAKYIVRIGLETMRLGTAVMTLLDALAQVYCGDRKERPKIEWAYNISSDIGLIATTLGTGGLKAVEKIEPTVGRPIKMMAAQRVTELELIPEKMPKYAIEGKYDGERAQIHKDGSSVKIFSRRLDEITDQYPDVVEYVKSGVKEKSVILEGEIVAIKGEKLMPFQYLMQRKRKYDIREYVAKIPVKVFLFDVLYAKGKSVMGKNYPDRRKLLEDMVVPSKNLGTSIRIIPNNLEEVQDFFEKGLAHGTEGIMAKSLGEDSIYRAGARAWLWIKWKKDYLEGEIDTFDLVLLGAIKGTGKRTGKYGTVIAATWNPERDIFESFCKIGTGFTDETLDGMPEKFKKIETKNKPKNVECELDADIWFVPEIVLEVSGAEITESPLHACAKTELRKGLSLRFPRFKQYRENKSAEQATTTAEVISMYEGAKN